MSGRERLDRRDPYQIYRDARVISVLEPGSHHGSKMRDISFKVLHNNAARFLLSREGIEETPETFEAMRSRVAAMVAEDMSHQEKNGVTPKLGPQISRDPYYKRIGD